MGNAELPHVTRQNIISAFNQSLVELLIATDAGFQDNLLADEGVAAMSKDKKELADEEEEQPVEEASSKRKGKQKIDPENEVAAGEEMESKPKTKKKKLK